MAAADVGHRDPGLQARLGHSAALVLIGEAGIGKSSLMDHAMRGADGMRLLLAVGTEAESTVAFAGLHQLLNPVLDHLPASPSSAAGWSPTGSPC
ncbi:hypothetical protein V3N99_07385 [Dermatophilaceae bacterium Soc4.6]